jgi:hypothetical protein
MSGIKSIPMAINPMEIVIGIVDLMDIMSVMHAIGRFIFFYK